MTRLQLRHDERERAALVRLTLGFLAVFAVVIAALSLVAYFAIEANLRSLIAPALDTPEGRAGLASALRPVAGAIVSVDALLLALVGLAAYLLARAALAPLRRAAEREQRFAADAAHELRTPLAAIGAIAQARANDANAGASELRDAFATIARRAMECGALVADLLTLARADDGSELDRAPLGLRELVERVALEVRADRPDLRVDVSCADVIVDGDERRLLQLVRNLAFNAGRYAVSRIELGVVAHGSDVLLSIDDDGPGVASDVAPRLFERFSKGADSRGSGLGLAIVRWSARAHGGDARHVARARFEVRLPRGR